MALKPGSNESESPADNDELEVDAPQGTEDSAVDRNADAEQETPTPADPPPADQVDETETPAKPAAAPQKPSKPSPVEAAIAKLTAPPEEADLAEPGARKATEAKPANPKDGTAETDPVATGDDQQNDKSKAKDALDDWSPEERKHTKGRVKERYRKLHDEHEQAKPFVEVGRGWSDFVAANQLAPDLKVLPDEGMAVAIRTQAAALRVATAAREKREVPAADVAWLQRNREAIDQVLGMAGHSPAKPAPAEDLSKVEVTQEVRDLQDAFGVLKSEDELRAVQAALNRVRGKKPAAGKPADETPPIEQPRAPAPAAPAARQVPWTTHDEQLAKAAIREDLVRAGIPSEKIAGHFAANITPLVSKRLAALYPGENPDAAWANLSPSNRRELVAQAHRAWAEKAKPATPRAPVRAPTPQPVQGAGSRPALTRVASGGKGAVSATIDALCVGETE
jgi:hypothetical protein